MPHLLPSALFLFLFLGSELSLFNTELPCLICCRRRGYILICRTDAKGLSSNSSNG